MTSPLIIDIAGTELTPDDRRRIAHPLVGGLIYFARNWHDRAQITALSAEIKSIRPDLLICIDHEGGRVQRFRADGFTHLPAMRYFGDLWSSDASDAQPTGATRAMDAACAAGHVLASELRACGIDFSFTPVLDLHHGASSVIGDRSFSRDPRIVAALARCVAHGLLRAGMQHCGKHFPGHGYAQADSHIGHPSDDRPLEAILADDASPYAGLSATLTAVMPAHVVYTQVDDLPAGFSRRWLQDVLRQRLGFDGAIVSDDLSMEGARRVHGKAVSHVAAALLALQAGCDLALLCNQSLGDGRAVDALIDGVGEAYAAGAVSTPDAERRRLALLPRGEASRWEALQADPAYRHARSLLPTA
ncbi:beta-N-acetylhexosaminidase [Xylophilus sp. GOD-11R]|uniref:beta-N-acetylhexosaminidase n=1 Tax=Xylophilus sp. GOD-11R TaxID=3089814 RepID=UPI00298CF226|nr:beta-N-acetylhexosaminidase [Xylophilus sp. GOD-11R]WPB55991.1 beta-N-acetylhexosaminidase [Xylophilus sp. GOD-11R]